MAYSVLVVQHSKWHPPGKGLVRLARVGQITLRVVEMWRESAAELAEFDALIILGGPCDHDQDGSHPLLGEEKRLVRAWMHLNRPCLGFNLGLHLIAELMGAVIGPAHVPGTGFVAGHLTHEGKKHPLFHGLRSPLTLFKGHGREIQSPLPRSMVLLATSKECMVEACCLEGRPHIVGLQCDNYLGVLEEVGTWRMHRKRPVAPGQPLAAELNAATSEKAAESSATFSLLLHNFITLVGR